MGCLSMLKGGFMVGFHSILFKIEIRAFQNMKCSQTKCGHYTQVVFICGLNNMENIPLGTCKAWFLFAGGLYI